jgi:hypothetical protein
MGEFRCDQAGLAFATTTARSSSSAGPLALGQLAGSALPSPARGLGVLDVEGLDSETRNWPIRDCHAGAG